MNSLLEKLFSKDAIESDESDDASIVLFPGPPGSIENRIVCAMKEEADESIAISLCTRKGEETTAVWIEGLPVVHGWAPAVRLLGRKCHMYSSTPEHALLLDEALDDLARFIRPFVEYEELTPKWVKSHIRNDLERLGKTLEVTDGGCLCTFDDPTVADVCWRVVIDWVFEWHLQDYDPEELLFEYGGSHLVRWFFDEEIHRNI